jgi:hypothetical protein
MTRPLVLALPDLNKQFIIKIDAKRVGIEAMLIQEGYLITYISKSIRLKQQALCTYKREILAILYAMVKWRHYL